tara:strand:+ start:17624 stop:18310 length:687 start_codon:yes stop_codon:yes gene_type:complete
MKCNIIYVAGHPLSEKCRKLTENSLKHHRYDYESIKGVTPDTIIASDFPFPNLILGRLYDFYITGQDRKYVVKKSCLFNNLKFAQRVIEADEPMIFLEHDTIAVSRLPDFDFDEFCMLSYDYAFKAPTALAKAPYDSYNLYSKRGVHDFPSNYPLRYYKPTKYKGEIMTPGTAAYALSPKGAKKLLQAAKKGIEQSDFIINSGTLRLQHLSPSPFRYQSVNPNLSHIL